MNIIQALCVFLLTLGGSLFAFQSSYITDPTGVRLLELDAPFFKAQFDPMGAQLKSLYYKPADIELVDPEQGSGSENVWNIPASRFFLQKKPFSLNSFASAGNWLVEAQANHPGGGINFLKVHKGFNFYADAAMLRLDYKMENLEDAMATLDYGFWFHHALGVYGELTSTWYPSAYGIVCIPADERPTETWQHQPARGWIAASTTNGKGVAITMSYPELRLLYSWFSGCKVPTLEWRTSVQAIAAGGSYRTKVDILPFSGLSKVSGAGGGLVGEILDGEKTVAANEKVRLSAKVHNARSGKVNAKLMCKNSEEENWRMLQQAELDFPSPATVAGFEFELESDKEGFTELEIILSDSEKELARLNSYLIFGKSEQTWRLQALEERVSSSSANIDLLKYNQVSPSPHIPWARPSATGKLKALMLLQHTNIPEVSQLAQRLDMDFVVPYLLYPGSHKGASPIYKLGDYFAATNIRDIEDNLEKALKQDYDLIMIGGLPWDYFKTEFQDSILAKVRQGCGLVYVGLRQENEMFPALQAYSGLKNAIPKKESEHFLTQGVPFEFLPAEPIHQFRAQSGTLASAGAAPYLSIGNYGKGRVLALTYEALFGRFKSAAGLTPNLPDSYENRAVPFEIYYAMLAKAAQFAAGKTPTTLFEKCDLSEKNGKLEISLQLNNHSAAQSTWELTLRDRYMQVRQQKNEAVNLKQGIQDIRLTMPSASFAGMRLLSIIVRNQNGEVINSGSWAVREQENTTRLEKLEIDKKDYENGEQLHFSARLEGGDFTQLQVKAELIDSYERTVASRLFAATSTLSGQLKINNALPARFYRLQLSLWDNEIEVDRLNKEFGVLPSKESRLWDDYEPGTWMTDDGTRFYLWKEQAQLMRKLRLRTLIANWRPMDHDFPIRYNFNPTMLHHVGLGRCSEPVEYAETGDKMLLQRKPCLSNPEFLERIKEDYRQIGKNQHKFGLRFYWMGDEQSLTGYGGTPIDFCFSEHCLFEFRNFLKLKYDSLAKLNQEWQCEFETWEEVLPFTKDEIWQGQGEKIAGWADHLEFMDGRLQNVVASATSSGRLSDPEAKFSISGTQAPTAYGGMDWWRQMKVFDGLMNYYSGGQHELQRSFKPDGDYMPWEFGYSSKGGILGYKIWKTLFLGYKGIMGFCYPSLVNPDWTLPAAMADSLPHLKVLSTGLGKHYLNNLHSQADIAVLYSQASIRAAFIEKRRDEHRLLREKLILLLRQAGASFDFVSYEQVEQGILQQGRYQTLILPDSSALSDLEVNAILGFAAAGHRIIAVAEPGRLQQNCRKRQENPLLELFAGNQHVLIPEIDTSFIEAQSYLEAEENRNLVIKELELWRRILGAESFKDTLKNPLLNGQTAVGLEYYTRFDSNGNPYFGVISKSPRLQDLQLRLPRKAHVYNAVNGKYYGKTDRLELPFCDALPLLITQLPRKISLASLKLRNGTLTVKLNQKLDSALRVQVFRPDGTEAEAYEYNLLLKKGTAQHHIPFVESDPAGTWRILVTEVISKEQKELSVKR